MATVPNRASPNYAYETLYVGRKMSESRAKERAEKRLLLVTQKETLVNQNKRKDTAAGGSHSKSE
jgi:hypothetical protein